MSIKQIIEKKLNNHTWFEKSWKNKDGDFINEKVLNIDEIANCTDDSVFFNMWTSLKENGDHEAEVNAQLDRLAEKKLSPILKTLREFKGEKGVFERVMIARPLTSTTS
jgi:ribonuclease HI